MKAINPRILIIDDNETFRQALKSLIRTGYPAIHAIDEAGNENQAFEKIASFVPDLIFSDISLPDENGLELIEKIKAAFPSASIVAMSHENGEEYEKAAIECGADRYVSKSVLTPDVIDELVRPIVLKACAGKTGERRKYPRYRSRDTVFVNMKAGNEEHLGKLLDIGEGGLSVCYPGSTDPACEYLDLGIFTMKDQFSIRNLQGRTVCSFPFTPPGAEEVSDMRRIGVQFLDPKAVQKTELDFFLRNHTAGEA